MTAAEELVCLLKQEKLKNNVCNYVLKYVTDNEDRRIDQGVSKFERARASQNILQLEGNLDIIFPKAFASQMRKYSHNDLVTCPQSLNYSITDKNTRLLTVSHLPVSPPAPLLSVREGFVQKVRLLNQALKGKKNLQEWEYREGHCRGGCVQHCDVQVENEEAFVLCAGKLLEDFEIGTDVIKMIGVMWWCARWFETGRERLDPQKPLYRGIWFIN